jgi:hypothetical protein
LYNPPLSRSEALRLLIARGLDTEFATVENPDDPLGVPLPQPKPPDTKPPAAQAEIPEPEPDAEDAVAVAVGEAETKWWKRRFPYGPDKVQEEILAVAFSDAVKRGLVRGSREFFAALDAALNRDGR